MCWVGCVGVVWVIVCMCVLCVAGILYEVLCVDVGVTWVVCVWLCWCCGVYVL